MTDEHLEELEKGAWVLVKALAIGCGVVGALALMAFAAIAAVTVVSELLGFMYAFALGACIFGGVTVAGIYVSYKMGGL